MTKACRIRGCWNVTTAEDVCGAHAHKPKLDPGHVVPEWQRQQQFQELRREHQAMRAAARLVEKVLQEGEAFHRAYPEGGHK